MGLPTLNNEEPAKLAEHDTEDHGLDIHPLGLYWIVDDDDPQVRLRHVPKRLIDITKVGRIDEVRVNEHVAGRACCYGTATDRGIFQSPRAFLEEQTTLLASETNAAMVLGRSTWCT